MPVLVTGAETAEGQASARRLRRGGAEVRAFVDYRDAAAAESLRAAGCKVARGALDDEGHLETALEQVHTVVHAAAGPLTDPDGMLDDAASVLSAAIGAGCRRLVLVSHLGAEAPRGNAYLEALAEIEELVSDAPLESVIIRRSLTYGPGDPLTTALAAGALPAEAAEATHSPLYVADLALAVAEADTVRRGVGELTLLLTLTGPTEVLLEGFADLLAAPGRVRATAPPLPAPVVDLLARDLVAADGIAGPTDIPAGLERLSVD